MRFRFTGLLSTIVLNSLVLSRLAIEALATTPLGINTTSPAPAPAADPEKDFCTKEQIANFEFETMTTDPKAQVLPIGETERYLAAGVVTLPPDSCVRPHTHWGAMVLFVRSGEIDFVAWKAPREDEPETGGLQLVVGTSTGRRILDFNEIVTLGPNDWVSQTGMVRHSFRNRSFEDQAVLVAATYSKLPDPDEDSGPGRCNGKCSGGPP